MKKMSLVSIGLCAAMVLGLAGCGSSSSTSTTAAASDTTAAAAETTLADEAAEAAEAGEGLNIAYVNAGMNTYYSLVLDGINEELERYGIADVSTVDVYSPTDTTQMAEQQITFLETLLQDEELDCLYFSTHNDEEFIPYLEQFSDKGVSVYLFNMPAQTVSDTSYYVSLVSYDFYDAGYKMGEYIAQNYTDMDIKMLYLEGEQGTHNTVRTEGFMQALEDNNADNVEIVVSQCAEWTREGGQSVTENALQSNPEINMIYGPYDEMPLGAIQALKDAGRTDVLVFGYDCTEPGLAAIRAGSMVASVNTSPKQMGNNLVIASIQHDLEGKEVDKEILNELVVVDSSNEADVPEDNYGYTEQEKDPSLTIDYAE